MNAKIRTIAIMAATLAAMIASAQAPFSLDTSFRTQIIQQYVNSVFPTPDGKVITSGVMRFPGMMSDKQLARLNNDGTLDNSFYNSGYGGGKIVPWQNKLYAAGNYLIRRILLPSGSNDTSFHMNNAPHFAPLQGGDYHVFPDGRLLISGSHQLSDSTHGFVGYYELIWFTNTGYLDTTRVHRNGNGAIYEFKELPNGQFICSGVCTVFEGVPVDKIFRVNADGSPDTTFHSGIMTQGSVGDFLTLGDGRIYACGSFRKIVSPNDTLRLARFLSDGSLDPSFNIPHFDDGAYSWPFGAFVSQLYPWSDGRIIAMGQFQYVNGELRKGICMLDSTGQLLPEFEGCGVDSFTYFGSPYATVEFMTVDTAANMIYICGAYTDYSDGIVNDTLQRFITRLYGDDLSTTVEYPSHLGSRLQVSPNPTGTNVHVSWSLPATRRSNGTAELSIVNVQGKLVRTLPCDLSRESMEVDVSDIAPGIYHLHLVQQSVWITGGKLVVE